LAGNKEAAFDSYEKAAALNPKRYPWEKETEYTLQLEQALFTKSVDALKSKFHDLRERHPEFARTAEASLNRFGYELLGLKKTREAIEIFKINAEAFPASWNVYDSLAEAYMESGNNKLAIKNYEKSIALNPENSGARDKLKKLKEIKR
jgi:tetratricopeptide (TPR) repeat protein